MIYYLCTNRFSATIRYFLRDHPSLTRGLLSFLSYEELFFERSAPIGHYIFTDFDRLSRYELECAAGFAKALQVAEPSARILNHPLKAMERYPLLTTLHRAGINGFTATRVDAGERPPRYPVFIRAEDGYAGPETDLLHNDAEYDAAVGELERRGLPRRGRIAIGFANERSQDGFFYKYGAYNIGGRVLVHDRLRGRGWSVKYFNTGNNENTLSGCDFDFAESEVGIEEEVAYMKSNPHRETLARAFGMAGIDFGRADYGVVNDRVQIYEINTNPHLTLSSFDTRRIERRALLLQGLLSAFASIDVSLGAKGRVYFKEPRPRAHDLHLPRRHLAASLLRRAVAGVRRRF